MAGLLYKRPVTGDQLDNRHAESLKCVMRNCANLQLILISAPQRCTATLLHLPRNFPGHIDSAGGSMGKGMCNAGTVSDNVKPRVFRLKAV